MMKGIQNVEESLETGIVLSIFVAGLNALWGILLLPWGVVGILFALMDIFLAFLIKKIKSQHGQGKYDEVRNNLRIAWPLGVVFGFVFLGVYYYLIYRSVDELLTKSCLIRDVEDIPIYPSPKIPQNKF